MEPNLFPKAQSLKPETQIEYQDGSIVSKTIVKKEKGNITCLLLTKVNL
jgi:hypothetical protein